MLVNYWLSCSFIVFFILSTVTYFRGFPSKYTVWDAVAAIAFAPLLFALLAILAIFFPQTLEDLIDRS